MHQSVGHRRTCAITGASGYVGSRIASHLTNLGWQVRELSRSGSNAGSHSSVRFELGDAPALETLAGVDALVHAAYDFGQTRWSDISRVNVDGSRKLFALARQTAVDRIVYVSTVAAFPEARSLYGRAKLETERVALEAGAAVIRPGLVWGSEGAALIGTLQRAVRLLPLVPLPAPPDLELTLAHEEDLALLVSALLDSWPDGAGELFVAAAEQRLGLMELLRSFAERLGKRRRFVRVPYRPVLLALRTLEALGMKPPFRSDSLLSLLNTDPDPLARATAPTSGFGVTFRPYSLR